MSPTPKLSPRARRVLAKTARWGVLCQETLYITGPTMMSEPRAVRAEPQRTIDHLEKRGLLTHRVTTEDGRSFYDITDAGRQALAE